VLSSKAPLPLLLVHHFRLFVRPLWRPREDARFPEGDRRAFALAAEEPCEAEVDDGDLRLFRAGDFALFLPGLAETAFCFLALVLVEVGEEEREAPLHFLAEVFSFLADSFLDLLPVLWRWRPWLPARPLQVLFLASSPLSVAFAEHSRFLYRVWQPLLLRLPLPVVVVVVLLLLLLLLLLAERRLLPAFLRTEPLRPLPLQLRPLRLLLLCDLAATFLEAFFPASASAAATSAVASTAAAATA